MKTYDIISRRDLLDELLQLSAEKRTFTVNEVYELIRKQKGIVLEVKEK